jgi:uroporphyrin-III C-methyltransferase/precorrin-2 dehydrogenase/sirohydrochlorin ferrochelatase
MQPLLPLFLDLSGRRVLLVGGGPVAAAKLVQLLAARADVRVVSPDVCDAIARSGVAVARRGFDSRDLDDVWLVVAAATPAVNAHVAEAAEARRVFVNAVDDPAHASAYLSGVVRRDGVTLAISTSGAAPALTALLREALDAVLPADLDKWVEQSARERARWRRDRVPIEDRRPRLLEALNELYANNEKVRLQPDTTAGGTTEVRLEPDTPVGGTPHTVAADAHADPTACATRSTGRVSLVGAGPGDPGLLTRRAVARLRAADLVLYDALIDRRVLKLARRAQRFFVGKRAHQHAMSQAGIHALMIRAARRGKRVVRLKGGDPFVFGRGGEEAGALQAAGIPFEIVPGVTSATAAPALAGIPMTHRGVSSAFLVVGGHDDRALLSAIDLVVPDQVTLVVMMGMARRAAIARQLVGRGWHPETPAAIIVDASKSTQAVWRGTLGTLPDAVEIELDGAGTIVIGKVVDVGLAIVASENSRGVRTS